jgi:hypothetical protein
VLLLDSTKLPHASKQVPSATTQPEGDACDSATFAVTTIAAAGCGRACRATNRLCGCLERSCARSLGCGAAARAEERRERRRPRIRIIAVTAR